jgi:hypothetical protein
MKDGLIGCGEGIVERILTTGYSIQYIIHHTLMMAWEVLMFSYKAHRRFERVRKSGRLYQQYREKEKLLFVFKDNTLVNCWRFEHPYEKLDGIPVHQRMAGGEGPIVRHLCSDNRCVNPLHLLRGTDYENALDEIDVRDFENELMMNMLEDWSMLEEPDKTLIHLTLLPKVSVKLTPEMGYRSLGEVNKDLREFYRQNYVQGLLEIPVDWDVAALANSLEVFRNRQDISVITIPGR